MKTNKDIGFIDTCLFALLCGLVWIWGYGGLFAVALALLGLGCATNPSYTATVKQEFPEKHLSYEVTRKWERNW
tara:strand:+ start:411 stop:632 length:222 start_codon:yes stop_codon:yes gene_type:complete